MSWTPFVRIWVRILELVEPFEGIVWSVPSIIGPSREPMASASIFRTANQNKVSILQGNLKMKKKVFALFLFQLKKLLNIFCPSPPPLPVPKNAKLRSWISKEVNNYIFAWYHAENEEPWDLPSDPRIDSKEMVYHGGNILWVNSHIQEIPENGADAAHLMAVHGDTVFSGAHCGRRNWLWSLCGSHGWEANWRQKSEENQKHVALSEIQHYLRFFNKYRMFDVNIVAEQVRKGK